MNVFIHIQNLIWLVHGLSYCIGVERWDGRIDIIRNKYGIYKAQNICVQMWDECIHRYIYSLQRGGANVYRSGSYMNCMGH